ncbi:MAG: bifunctional (p)ppGpp synthetase/guanosine-3',5'-bis(diphosphate) 3'-pyrophosphohydrolase [Chloroherpetonaceae bacterium]|nr:bifunctional (p)ppGpp synthetase/guanosine-3',5'-bis(diphosphate) 3'-pyrophosphohydrolase [Chloroherpetonaceae bacterium]MDW8436853.1 bifunctional (p)ppGpp synthetase/guanosine-3',5'-bis(diphosphate) 3'-pyrophosphohydrolase [Chloroherpetonaceae bacterium]
MLAQIEEEHYVKLDELISLCRSRLRKCDEDLIRRAFFLCYRAHSAEKRASGEPYFYHPVEVAKIMLEEIPLDDVSVAAALLHDVVEDSDYTIEDLRDEFGEEVARLVEGLTKISGIFANREIKEAESFRKMLLSMIDDIRVILIKFCDRLHNMRTLDALPPHRQVKIATETRDIYAPFAHRFGLGKIKIELENLALKYLDREAYDDISARLALTRTERIAYLEKISLPIQKELTKRGFKFEIQRRPKHIYSIYNKMRQQNKSFDQIYDIYGIRVILDTDDSSDCFGAYGYITQIYPPVPERFKDYISVPKHNGYQSLHTTVIAPGGKMVEIQIRTRKMHEFAESGIAAHWRYKEKVTSADEGIDQLIKWARDLVANANTAQDFMEGFRLNLYQDEIYVFTPKGDMKVLPVGATAVDFAFEIHTEIGMHCIGAKVNGKMVSLQTRLKSGDQVEILTSKNQTPKADWEKFVVTHKAKLKIRQFLNETRRKEIEEGRNIWNKLVAKTKRLFTESDIVKLARFHGLPTPADFFRALGAKEIDSEKLLEEIEPKAEPKPEPKPENKNGVPPVTLDDFARQAREVHGLKADNSNDAVVISGLTNVAHSYAKCCNPVPGDDIIGLVTAGGTVKIHRRNCVNVNNEQILKSPKVVTVQWKPTATSDFLAGIRIYGEDKLGMTNEITHVIVKSEINIRSISLNAKDGIFEGTVILYVKNIEHLQRVVERLRKVEGVFAVERFSNN